MTGHQHNPTTGKNCKGEPAPSVDLVALCKACGVKRVREVDPYDIKALKLILKEETAAEEPSVIITRRPCVLLDKKFVQQPYKIDADACRDCGSCMRIGCPAIAKTESGMRIDASQCVGFGLCTKLCGFGTIRQEVKA